MPIIRFGDADPLGIRNAEYEDQVTDIWFWVGEILPIQIIRNSQFQVPRTKVDQDDTRKLSEVSTRLKSRGNHNSQKHDSGHQS